MGIKQGFAMSSAYMSPNAGGGGWGELLGLSQ
jgi:hypothetical protein